MAGTHLEWMNLKSIRISEIGKAHNFYLFYFCNLIILDFIQAIIFPIIYLI